MRLGNILFAIATAYAHSMKVGSECRVPWNYNADSRQLRAFLGEPLAPTLGGLNESPVYSEPSFSYKPIPTSIVEGALSGYFQSAYYFNDYVEEIRKLYHPFIAEKVAGTVGLHIRLGDYRHLCHKFHIVDAEFLSEALSRISGNVGNLVLFSDEPDLAMSMMSALPEAKRFRLEIDRGNFLQALHRMTSMEEMIISCSSFSWWGAYLGQQQKVLVPARWFNSEISDYDDIYLPHWERI